MTAKRATAAARPAATRRAATRIEFHPATPERWADVESLFGPRGACGGCWCQWPRLRGAEFSRGKGEPNKRALRRQVEGGSEPGIIAYVDGVPAAWCALAPREAYPRITHSRLFADDAPAPETWSVVCFFVARPFRGQRLTVRLLDAAAAYAKRHGARLLEGYPVDPGARRVADAFVWTGLAAAFVSASFTEVARPSPTRPLMRRVLGHARGSEAATSPKVPTASKSHAASKPTKSSQPSRLPKGPVRG